MPSPSKCTAGLSPLLTKRLQEILTGWSALIIGPLLLVLLLLGLIWSLTIAKIMQDEMAAREHAIAESRNIAHIMAANLAQVLGRTRIYAGLASAQLVGKQPLPSPILLGDAAYLRLAAFDGRGKLRFSSAQSASEPEMSGLVQEYLRQPRSSPSPTALLVGRPAGDDGNAWRVPLLVPLAGDGPEQGFLAAIVDLGYFLKLYQDVELGSGGRIEIIGEDGYRLVASTGLTLSAGKDLRGTDYFGFLQQGKEGSGIIRRPGEESRSAVAFRKLDAYPLIVAVSRSYEDILTGLALRREPYLWWAALFSLALTAFAVSQTILARRHRSMYRALARSESEKLKLIEQLEDEKDRAYELASHDHLTGLPNRRLFAELATSHVSRAVRSRQYYAVLFIDLDRFKVINDTFGHKVGDLLLQIVATRLRSCSRESDLIARFGGDEFVMMLNEVASIDDVSHIAAKVVAVVGEPCLNLDGHDLVVKPSVGIAIYPQDGLNIDSLLKHADAAMYEAKLAGRGTFRFYDAALNALSELHQELLQHFRRAINEDEFTVYYQPKVDLNNYAVVGLEALLRWQHPQHGLLYPGNFIMLAEENGLIADLGQWVIDAVCCQQAAWAGKGIALVPVAVNVSAKQLRDESLVTDIAAALGKYGVSPNLLEIEVTESCLLEQAEQAIRVLDALVEKGLTVSIDDYGTGFSNLSYLKLLPIHALKIDRSFIRDIRNDANDAVIVASTITLAHNLGLRVVAEGVETREQLVHLKTAGCDEVQGYYLQRPASADETETLLSKPYRLPS